MLGKELARAIIADFNVYVVPALLEKRPPKHLMVTEFSSRVGWDRKGLYEKKFSDWIPMLRVIAAAIPMAKNAQDGDGPAACMFEQTTSPVGEKASGAGIPVNVSTRKKTQMLFGSTLSGLYTALVAPLTSDLHPTELSGQLAALVDPLGPAAEAVRSMAELPPQRLERLGLDPQRLRKHQPSDVALVPRLHVGPELKAGTFESISCDPKILVDKLKAASNGSPRRAVVECLGEWASEQQFVWLPPDEIRRVLGWRYLGTPFDPNEDVMEIEYGISSAHDETRLLRYVVDGASSAGTVARMMSFVLVGFDFRMDRRKALIDAIHGVEKLASRSAAGGPAASFGKDFAPARIGPRESSARTFIYLSRIMAHAVMTIVAAQPGPSTR